MTGRKPALRSRARIGRRWVRVRGRDSNLPSDAAELRLPASCSLAAFDRNGPVVNGLILTAYRARLRDHLSVGRRLGLIEDANHTEGSNTPKQ
ncbi:hypothetical protein [Nocardia transvalensis]|uniref:hypothetical protein n=1 Tax=Nocardia transvalensis TaxID=37333 RepID=UPI001892DF7A|nr:hypothetical protein [Nocardia transvalensis]MBF6333561.1 hypothetical protein [Nocardia transvalensis]